MTLAVSNATAGGVQVHTSPMNWRHPEPFGRKVSVAGGGGNEKSCARIGANVASRNSGPIAGTRHVASPYDDPSSGLRTCRRVRDRRVLPWLGLQVSRAAFSAAYCLWRIARTRSALGAWAA